MVEVLERGDIGAEIVLVAGDPEHDLGIDVLAIDDVQHDANELHNAH